MDKIAQAVNTNSKTLYCFGTAFYKLLHHYGYDAVEDSTKPVDIFSYSKVMWPVHMHDHWRLIMLDTEKGTLQCFDSFCTRRNSWNENQNCLTVWGFSALKSENVSLIPVINTIKFQNLVRFLEQELLSSESRISLDINNNWMTEIIQVCSLFCLFYVVFAVSIVVHTNRFLFPYF